MARFLGLAWLVLFAACKGGEGGPPRAGLVAYYPLDDSASDQSGNGNDGTVHGAVWATGMVDGALDFDGQDDYVEVPYDSSLDMGEAVSIELLLNKYSDAPYAGLVGRGDMHAYNLMFDVDGKRLRMEFIIVEPAAGPPWTDFDDEREVPTGVWTHAAVTFDDATDELKFYVDGQVSGEIVAAEEYRLRDTTNLVIGCQGLADNIRFFHGLIDEVAIYSRALAAWEVQQHYDRALHGGAYFD